jgi:hypothetical protein
LKNDIKELETNEDEILIIENEIKFRLKPNEIGTNIISL